MSAQELRQAAALMRERAEAATPGPWEVVEDSHRGYVAPAREISVWSASEGRYVTEDVSMVESSLVQWRVNAKHIASWDPAKTLLVADLLDQAAAMREESNDGPLAMVVRALTEPADTLAHAYLGSES